MGRPHQTHRPRQSRDPSVPPAGCRFAPTPGSGCSSGRCEPHPETIPRLVHRVVVLPGLALIAIPELRKLRLRRRIGLRVARTRRQPTQLHPVQQPVGARQAAVNRKLLFQYSLRVDPTKRHHPVPRQLGASDNPFLEPRTRRGVDPWLSTPGCRPLAVDQGAAGHVIPQGHPPRSDYATRRPPTGSAQPAAPPPRAPSPRACSRSSEPAGTHARSPVGPSVAAPPPPGRCERSIPASSIPQTWYTRLITLPHLGITGSRYNNRTVERERRFPRRLRGLLPGKRG